MYIHWKIFIHSNCWRSLLWGYGWHDDVSLIRVSLKIYCLGYPSICIFCPSDNESLKDVSRPDPEKIGEGPRRMMKVECTSIVWMSSNECTIIRKINQKEWHTATKPKKKICFAWLVLVTRCSGNYIGEKTGRFYLCTVRFKWINMCNLRKFLQIPPQWKSRKCKLLQHIYATPLVPTYSIQALKVRWRNCLFHFNNDKYSRVREEGDHATCVIYMSMRTETVYLNF
jgi:hypothetical protein